MLYIITFPSTYQALNFEKKFKDAGLSFTLRPVPREISSSCGIAAQIKTDYNNVLSIWEECKKSSIETDGLYSFQKEKGKGQAQKIKGQE